MCIACGDPLSSPVVSSVTVATSPRSCTDAVPLPVTRFVGTGSAAAVNLGLGGEVGEVPEVNAMTAATAPPTITKSAAAGHRYFAIDLAAPSGPPPSPAEGVT